MAKRTLSDVMAGLLAGATGVFAGEQEARQRQFEQQNILARQKMAQQDQSAQLFGQAARHDREAQEALLEPYRFRAGLQGQTPESMQAGIEAYSNAVGQQGASPFTGESFQQYVQSGGKGQLPSRVSPAPVRGVVPKAQFINRDLEDAYSVPIAMREKRLAEGVPDPQQAKYLQMELNALRQGKAKGLPLEGVRVGQEYGLGGLEVRPSIPSLRADPKDVTYIRASLDALKKDLSKYVASAPEGSEQRKLREEQVAPIFARASGFTRFETDQDLDRAKDLLQDPAISRLRFSNNASTETLEEQQRLNRVKRYEDSLKEVRGGPDVAPLPAHVARIRLPALLKAEQELKGDPTVLPYLAAEKDAIGRLEAINKELAENKALSNEERASLDAESLGLAQEVQERLGVGLTPKQEMDRLEQAVKILGNYSVADLAAGKGQQVIDGLKIGHLLSPEAMAGGRAEKMFGQMLGRMQNAAKLSPTAQKPYVNALSLYAQLGGMPAIDASTVLKLEPTDKEKLALQRERLSLRGDKLDVAKARFELQKAQAEAKLKEQQVKFNDADRLMLSEASKVRAQAQKEYESTLSALRKSGSPFWASFDPEVVARQLESGEPLLGTPAADAPFWEPVERLFAGISGAKTRHQRDLDALLSKEEKLVAVAKSLVGKYQKWKDAEDNYAASIGSLLGEASVRERGSGETAPPAQGILNGGAPVPPANGGKGVPKLPRADGMVGPPRPRPKDIRLPTPEKGKNWIWVPGLNKYAQFTPAEAKARGL